MAVRVGGYRLPTPRLHPHPTAIIGVSGVLFIRPAPQGRGEMRTGHAAQTVLLYPSKFIRTNSEIICRYVTENGEDKIGGGGGGSGGGGVTGGGCVAVTYRSLWEQGGGRGGGGGGGGRGREGGRQRSENAEGLVNYDKERWVSTLQIIRILHSFHFHSHLEVKLILRR